MHTLKTTTIVSVLSLLLSACGGGSDSPLINNPGTSSGSTSSGAVDTTTAQKIGSGTGDSFQSGVIGVSNGITNLSAGGSTTLEVYVVSSTNTPVVAAATVNFISSCIAANKAVLKNSAGTEASSTTTINGRATMTYTANGCVGTDRVTASTTIGGTTIYANIDLNIEAGTVGSIQFDSAAPEQISLKGTGSNETSVVRFRVLDGNSAPIENTSVTFALSATPGGLSLSPATVLSDSDGYVSTTVSSGTVSTEVSVTATVTGSSISTTSRILKVSTGIPVQRFASLSFSKLNPHGWHRDGEEVTVTMRMADDFGNPVVDGTAVTFWTEGGAIGPNCTTTNGQCSVIWKSQEERPINGRVTVLAFTSGNESFTDANSNGRYDEGELFEDLGEAFLDIDENGNHTQDERFVDLNNNGSRDGGNGMYNGTLCDSTTCSKEKITIRKSGVIAMSGPTGTVALFSNESCSTPIASIADDVYLYLADINGNSLINGSTVIVKAGSTELANFTVANSANATCRRINANGGTSITVELDVPGEGKTTYPFN